MKKINIIALVGMSGSGKTHASLLMGKHKGFKNIVSFTTRPMRPGEVDGVDHWFVKPEDKPSDDEMLAYTKFGGYEYWTSWSQFSNSELNYVYVIDEKGLIYLKEKPGFSERVNLFSVKIVRPNRDEISEERKNRDNERVDLDDLLFDVIISNDSTLEDFNKKINFICSNYGSTNE